MVVDVAAQLRVTIGRRGREVELREAEISVGSAPPLAAAAAMTAAAAQYLLR